MSRGQATSIADDAAMLRDGCTTAPSAAVSYGPGREEDRELVEDDPDSALFGPDWKQFFKRLDWKRFAASPLASQNLLEESLDFLEESAAAEVKRRNERNYTSPVPEPIKADKARTGILKYSCEGTTPSALSRGSTMPILPQQRFGNSMGASPNISWNPSTLGASVFYASSCEGNTPAALSRGSTMPILPQQSFGNGMGASPNILWNPSTQMQLGASVMHASVEAVALGPPEWNSRIHVQQPPVQPMLMPFNISLLNQAGQTLLMPPAGAALAPNSAPAESQDSQPPVRSLDESQAISIFLEKRSGNKDHTLSGRLAHRYGVTSKTVRDIWRMRTWKRSTEPYWTLSDRQEFLRRQTAHVPNSNGSSAGT